jgi:hypothetical protein
VCRWIVGHGFNFPGEDRESNLTPIIHPDPSSSMSYRPETFTIKGLQDSLASAPRRLLLICVCQILLLCCGVFVGHGSAECEVRLPQGSAIEGKNKQQRFAVAHPVCGLVD